MAACSVEMKFLKNGNSYKKLMYPKAFVIYTERTGKRRNYHSEHTPLIYAHIMLMIKENLENSFIPSNVRDASTCFHGGNSLIFILLAQFARRALGKWNNQDRQRILIWVNYEAFFDSNADGKLILNLCACWGPWKFQEKFDVNKSSTHVLPCHYLVFRIF